jgi:PAS domain S-box-containing protein
MALEDMQRYLICERREIRKNTSIENAKREMNSDISPSGIIDPSDNLIAINSKFRKSFGYREEDLIQKNYLQFIDAEEHEQNAIRHYFQQPFTQGPIVLGIKTKSGRVEMEAIKIPYIYELRKGKTIVHVCTRFRLLPIGMSKAMGNNPQTIEEIIST